MHNFKFGFLPPCQNLKKLQENSKKIPKERDRQKDGEKGKQTLFYRTPPVTAGGPIKFLTIFNLIIII